MLLGAKVGVLLSLLYTTLVTIGWVLAIALMDPMVHEPWLEVFGAFAYIFIYGMVLGVLPALIIGTITGLIVGMLQRGLRDEPSRRTLFLIGAAPSAVIALLVNVLAIAAFGPMLDNLPGFLIFFGIPSLIYIGLGGVMSVRLAQMGLHEF